MDANCSGVFWRRSASPSSPLDTAISEEVRPGAKAEREAQRPLPGSTGRRHTLAEVSTLSPCTTPCKCPMGRRVAAEQSYSQGCAGLMPNAPVLLIHLLWLHSPAPPLV